MPHRANTNSVNERTGGWQPVWDLGIEGFAQDQPDTDDDCSEMPAEVADLIAAQE